MNLRRVQDRQHPDFGLTLRLSEQKNSVQFFGPTPYHIIKPYCYIHSLFMPYVSQSLWIKKTNGLCVAARF